MLHHVEGVVREVDLLYAVDDLLLCLWVDGLLPQLPQLLLKEGETDQRSQRVTEGERIKICASRKQLHHLTTDENNKQTSRKTHQIRYRDT